MATILEQLVPLMDYADPVFLSQLENDLETPIYNQGTPVVQACLKALTTVVTQLTHNTLKIEQIFTKFYQPLVHYQKVAIDSNAMKTILRGLAVVGLLCRYFDF